MNEKFTNKDLKLLAGQVYKSNTEIKNWQNIQTKQNNLSGFKGTAYMKGNDIVISYSGTNINQVQDWGSDIAMGAGFKPAQLNDARTLYNNIRTSYPKANITFTGHSLGGSLAQLMSAETGERAITFSAFGTKKILMNQYKNFDTDNLNIISTIFIRR